MAEIIIPSSDDIVGIKTEGGGIGAYYAIA